MLSEQQATLDPDNVCRWCKLATLTVLDVQIRDDNVVFVAYECFCCHRHTTIVYS